MLNFSNMKHRERSIVRMDAVEVPQTGKFWYLVTSKKRDIGKDISYIINAND